MTALFLDQVSKSFGRGDSAVRAVDSISLAVQPGEAVLVMGPSGSGKTSLLAIAGTLMRPDSRARHLLDELGLNRRTDFLPAQLSGGEKQRVAIARAMGADPAIILADEPTANLDSRSGQQVTALLAQVARERGKAVVIVSHDSRLREIADRVIWMEDGRLHHGGEAAD